MKLSEIKDKNTNLLNIKIKLTPELKEAYANYSSKGEDEVYIIGSMMGDFFISPDARGVNKRRLYPMPEEVEPKDLLECQILEDLKEAKDYFLYKKSKQNDKN